MFECCQRLHLLSARLQTSRRQGRKGRLALLRTGRYKVRRTRSDTGQSDLSCRRFCRTRRLASQRRQSNSSLTGETVITGRMLDLMRACRINSDLAHFTEGEHARKTRRILPRSSRVLTTRLAVGRIVFLSVHGVLSLETATAFRSEKDSGFFQAA